MRTDGTNEKILDLLQDNDRLTPQQIADRLGLTEGDVAEAIQVLEASGVIRGYQATINWEKTDRDYVTALIEVNVAPQREKGFDHIASRIYAHPQVRSCYLMSGGFDLMVIIEDKSLKDVALFVTDKIAPLDAVLSTRTHFILRKYKHVGTLFAPGHTDTREAIVL